MKKEKRDPLNTRLDQPPRHPQSTRSMSSLIPIYDPTLFHKGTPLSIISLIVCLGTILTISPILVIGEYPATHHSNFGVYGDPCVSLEVLHVDKDRVGKLP